MSKKEKIILAVILVVGVVGYYFVNENIKKGKTVTAATGAASTTGS